MKKGIIIYAMVCSLLMGAGMLFFAVTAISSYIDAYHQANELAPGAADIRGLSLPKIFFDQHLVLVCALMLLAAGVGLLARRRWSWILFNAVQLYSILSIAWLLVILFSFYGTSRDLPMLLLVVSVLLALTMPVFLLLTRNARETFSIGKKHLVITAALFLLLVADRALVIYFMRYR